MAAEQVEFIVSTKDEATKSLEKISNGFEGLGGTVKNLAIAFAGIFSINAIKDFAVNTVKELADTGEAFQKMSASTGVSIKSLSALKQTAAESSIPMEALTGGLRKLQIGMGDLDGQGKETKKAMDFLGLSFKDVQKMKPEDQFIAIGNKIAAVTDPATKTALAMQFFGRAGTELIPFFEKGNLSMDEMVKHAEALGVAFDDDMVKKANDADAAFDQLDGAWKGFMTTIGVTIAPLVTMIVQGISFIIQQLTNWQNTAQQINDYFKTWGIDLSAIWESIKNAFGEAWDWINTNVVPKAQKFIEDIRQRIQPMIQFFQDHWDTISMIFSVVFDTISIYWSNFWETFIGVLSVAWEVFAAFIKVGLSLIQGDWSGAWSAIKEMFINIWNIMKNYVNNVLGNIIKYISDQWIKVKESVQNMSDTVTKIWSDFWNGLKKIVDDVVSAIKKIIDEVVNSITFLINGVKDLINLAGQAGSGFASGITNAISGKKARGGPVNAGARYLVGEEGPELFEPSSSGRIIPNDNIGGDGKKVNIVMNFNGPVSSKEVALEYANIAVRELQFHSQVI